MAHQFAPYDPKARDWRDYWDAYRARLQPRDLIEEDLVQEMASARWHLNTSVPSYPPGQREQIDSRCRKLFNAALSNLCKLRSLDTPPRKPGKLFVLNGSKQDKPAA